MTRTVNGLDELRGAVGEELGVSSWYEVTQPRIDAFAESTGDHYPIHVDPISAAESPLGSTIAHGLLTLALGPMFTYEIVTFAGFSLILNYGYDKVRFVSPLPVDTRVRMRSQLIGVDVVESGARATLRQTFEADGGSRPVCIAASILHFNL